MRRWVTATLAFFLCAVALAGKAGGTASDPEPAPPNSRKLPGSIAALGDSITSGLASCLLSQPCLRTSWATGDATTVSRHYQRLRAENGTITSPAG